MMNSPRIVLAAATLGIIAVVNLTAASFGPADSRWLLLLSGFFAIGAAFQSVAWEPSDLLPALLFSLPPVMSLVADGSPAWLIAILGALLLAAAELHALGWECDGVGPSGAATRRRFRTIAELTLAGAAAGALVLAFGTIPLFAGVAAVVTGGVAIALISLLLFRRTI